MKLDIFPDPSDQPLSDEERDIEQRYFDKKDYYDSTYEKLARIFGFEFPERTRSTSFTEDYYRRLTYSILEAATPVGDEPDYTDLYENRAFYAAAVARHLRTAVTLLKDEYGVDIIGDRKQLSTDAQLATDVQNSIREHIQSAIVEQSDSELSAIIEPQDGALVAAQDIAILFSSKKHEFARDIIAVEDEMSRTESPLRLNAYESHKTFFQIAAKDIPAARYDAQRALRYIMKDEVGDYATLCIDMLMNVINEEETSDLAAAADIINSKKQELDYTILPKGTQLEEVARDIVDQSPRGEKAHVDLKRIAVLEKVRQLHGAENCYYMRGKKTGKEMADDDGTLISEDYIGLIMQHRDNDGNVTSEDCLAISPIARKNAGYIVRQEASEGISWREILSLPKDEAIKYFNARRLRFDKVAGEDTYEAYTEKVFALLTCQKEEFGEGHYLTRMRDGSYKLRKARPRKMGSAAARGAATDIPHS